MANANHIGEVHVHVKPDVDQAEWDRAFTGITELGKIRNPLAVPAWITTAATVACAVLLLVLALR